MLGSAAQVAAVIKALKKRKLEHVVLDPVLASSSGAVLLDKSGTDVMMSELLPLATLFTPNIDELRTLSNGSAATENERIQSARSLIARGAKAVLVKGGHLEADPVDFLVRLDEVPICFQGDRVLTQHGRGTGCTLSSLIAGHLALGVTLYDAILDSKQALQDALRAPIIPRRGLGYPVPSDTATHDARLAKINGIYFVSDGSLRKEIAHTMGCRLALDGGANVVQLRAKEFEVGYQIDLARRVKRLSEKHRAVFIANDRVDVALASDADGVHLGPEDMDPETARIILGPTKIIGASVSTVEEGRRVADYVSYLAVGAIFGSSTKGDAGAPIGVDRITEIKNAFPDKKIVAIGGINLSNIASVAAAGADAAAVVSAIVCADDPVQATRDLLAEFNRGKASRK
jgi:thiamine-phosphate diphosphorylase